MARLRRSASKIDAKEILRRLPPALKRIVYLPYRPGIISSRIPLKYSVSGMVGRTG